MLRADPTLVEYLSALSHLYLEVNDKDLAVKVFKEVEELITLFKPPQDQTEHFLVIKQKLAILRPKIDAIIAEKTSKEANTVLKETLKAEKKKKEKRSKSVAKTSNRTMMMTAGAIVGLAVFGALGIAYLRHRKN